MDKIFSLTGTPHPKALVQLVNPANGIMMFRWLAADEKPVDSGNSGAWFTPVLPDEDGNYAEPSDAVLIAAIEAA